MANSSKNLLIWLAFVAIFIVQAMGSRLVSIGQKIDTTWNDAHATFYGDINGIGTMMGSCGYGDLFQQGYGLNTAALSPALYNNGQTCGACYEIFCTNDPQWCIPGAGSITITATNLCPPDFTKTQGIWCNPPQKHFDLTMLMFSKIANVKAGVIPVRFRRTPCSKQGGVKFEIKGNPNFLLVLPFNVGGAGDVVSVKVKGSAADWIQMTRNWGQNWQIGTVLVGQSLSFQVTVSDGRMVQFDNVAPSNWQFGQTFEGSLNF